MTLNIINSPIVDINVVLKASSENLNKRHVLPTPESPIRSNLNNKSYVFFAIFPYPTARIFRYKMADFDLCQLYKVL